MAQQCVQEDPKVESLEVEDRGLFDFMKKKEEERKEAEFAEEFGEKVNVSHEPVQAEHEYKEEEKKKEGLMAKLHRHDSSSSSSSSDEEEEYEEGGEKKKKKKALKDKIKDKISNHKEKEEDKKEKKHEKEDEKKEKKHDNEEEKEEKKYEKEEEKKEKKHEKEEKKHEDTYVPIEKYDEEGVVHSHTPSEEKKSIMEKLKEKLPGNKKEEVVEKLPGHKKSEEDVVVVESSPHPPPVPFEPFPEGEVKEKKGFLEKIKEKIPGFGPKQEEEKKEKE